MRKTDERLPRYTTLMNPLFKALKELGGSGSNDEILNRVTSDLALPDEVADILHGDRQNMTELAYQLTWAKTYLKVYGVLENSERGVWAIKPESMKLKTLDEKKIVSEVALKTREQRKANQSVESQTSTGVSTVPDSQQPEDGDPSNDEVEFPDELKPWRERLAEILQNMDPYGFERLSQRLLRECGFTDVQVTKKSGDGGIDGNGKLVINGIFSFHVAFQ